MHRRKPRHAFARKDTPLDEHLGRRPSSQPPSEPNGYEFPIQATRYDRGAGLYDGACNQIRARRATRRGEEGREYRSVAAQAIGMKDRSQSQLPELMICLGLLRKSDLTDMIGFNDMKKAPRWCSVCGYTCKFGNHLRVASLILPSIMSPTQRSSTTEELYDVLACSYVTLVRK